MKYTQENRLIAIQTPLGEDELLLSRFSGSEGISRLFEFELELFSENHAIDFKKIIGKEISVRIQIDDEKKRFFHGIVSRFSQKSGENTVGTEKATFSYYTATMVPFFWMLTQTADSRIFQEKSTPDIIEQIFKDQKVINYEINLKGSYDPKEYCVQYRETDYNFVCRLMEQEGIHYYFRHEEGKHTLVVADASEGNDPCPNKSEVAYQVSASALGGEDKIFEMEMQQEIRVAKYTVNDYNFKAPNSDLKTEVETQEPLGSGEREIYDYPAEYPTLDEGDRLANIRIQEEECQVTTITGSSRCRDFSSGHTFDLKEYYRKEMNDKSYLLTAVVHEASEPIATGGSEGTADYSNRFVCIPLDVPFRPPRTTPKPVAEGTQPAVVVGPSGEEIYTDEFGRVKVQFIWDREGKKDENSSCWVRVSQQWAGAGWGAMFIPHIGHEVIVDFEEGDPDRPVITGRVYNGNNKPHDILPDEKTKSVIRSWNDNDIVIEDKDGDKHIHIMQANGNEIILHEGTPSIDINQACGNFIHMRDGEGIHIQDHFGNEVKLDAAAGTLKVRSPSHESVMELGKSIQMTTNSNWLSSTSGMIKHDVKGDLFEITGGNKSDIVKGKINVAWDGAEVKLHGGAVSDTFVGAKHETLVGVKASVNASKEVNKNALSRDRKASGHLYYGSSAYIHLEGPGTELKLNSSAAELKAGATYVIVENGDSVMVKAASDIELVAGGDIHLKGGNIILNGNVVGKKTVENPSIKATK
ncbi:type VI secretion system tip protein TssI/VgrG [uncultured Desulfosarcina sp.]|uniref:type VI secretion system tip protein TssI/VgrG n=1 Tax=uncultured Desulfosarcina sp. TaxID=218289 RepID=UPI0029C7CD35|nr:type VI secretion system tip protein TssI/VgrG [uncultured Desulfosarcina sp.]